MSELQCVLLIYFIGVAFQRTKLGKELMEPVEKYMSPLSRKLATITFLMMAANAAAEVDGGPDNIARLVLMVMMFITFVVSADEDRHRE